MTNIVPVVDALGQPIAIGHMYGYSTSKSGWSRTVIGTAKNITPTGRVALDVVRRETFLYGKKSDYNPGSDNTCIRSHMLFPVEG